MCTYFNALATNLSEIQKDCNEEIKSTVDNINAIAQKIALLNKEVNRIEVNGGKANELRDERANLIDELSSIVNVEVIENEVINSNGANLGGTNYTVVINGQVLVEGNDYQKLMCVSKNMPITFVILMDFTFTGKTAMEQKEIHLQQQQEHLWNLKGLLQFVMEITMKD